MRPLPSLKTNNLNDPEVALKDHLEDILVGLSLSANNFSDTVDIIDYLEEIVDFDREISKNIDEPFRHLYQEEFKYRRWKMIAARDAAMTVFHFGQYLHGIGASSAKFPNDKLFINRIHLKEAYKIFNREFKGHRDMRDAVAHSAQLHKSLEDLERNKLLGNYHLPGVSLHGHKDSQTFIYEMLNGRDFVKSWNHKLVSVSVTSEKADALHQIVETAFQAFEPENTDGI